jgi:hypothetical protein
MHCNKYTIFFDAVYGMGHAAPFIRAAAWPRVPDLGLGALGGGVDAKIGG